MRVDDVAGIGPGSFCSPRRRMDADGYIEQYLPGPMFRLLLTGDIPTKAQVDGLSAEFRKRAELPAHVIKVGGAS